MLAADPRTDLVSPPEDPEGDKGKKEAYEDLLLPFGSEDGGGE